jgi:hypothetical protein
MSFDMATVSYVLDKLRPWLECGYDPMVVQAPPAGE